MRGSNDLSSSKASLHPDRITGTGSAAEQPCIQVSIATREGLSTRLTPLLPGFVILSCQQDANQRESDKQRAFITARLEQTKDE